MLGRTFAYVGVPPLNLFIGELVLGAFLVLCTRQSIGAWIATMVRPSPLTGLGWAVLALACYGIFAVVRGAWLGHPLLTTLQNLAFNYYPLYLFLGIYVARMRPGMLPTALRWLAWANGLYGMAYIAGLGRVAMDMPLQPGVRLFGQPGGSAIALLGLLAFERNARRAAIPALLNLIVLLGVQVRAEWLGLVAGGVAWMVVTRRIKPVIGVAAVGLSLLVFAYAIDLRIPAPRTRGRTATIAVAEIVGRAVAPISQDVASRYTDRSGSYAGTFEWRVIWWGAIWHSVHENNETAFLGHGYGYSLARLVPFVPDDVRTPHNLFFYALGYGGWLCVLVVAAFHAALGRALWRSWQVTQQAFGIGLWVLCTVSALFSNLYEAPFGAVPLFILAGMALEPLAWTAPAEQAAAPPSRRPVAPRRRRLARAY